jgi:hypothetical protein
MTPMPNDYFQLAMAVETAINTAAYSTRALLFFSASCFLIFRSLLICICFRQQALIDRNLIRAKNRRV